MRDYIKVFKDWKALAKPNKRLVFSAFFMVVLVQACILIAPTFEAKTTVAITSGEYFKAGIYLVVVFGILALRKLFWHIDYKFLPKIVKNIYCRINNEFIDKSLKAKSNNFKTTSKERLINIVHTDVYTVAEFADILANAAARFMALIVTVVIIFTVNIWAGVIVIVANVLDLLLMSWINTKRERYVKKLREDNDYQFEKFSEIIDTRETITDLGLENKVKKEYNQILDQYIADLYKRRMWDSAKDSFYEVFFRFIILVTTILLVILVAGHNLPLETYFLIVTYVTNGITNTNEIFKKIPEIKAVKIAQARVKTVLDFADKDEVEIGNNNLKDILGSICFNHVSYSRDDEGNPSINNIDVLFKENETSLILGTRSCGKRTIFNLLRRSISPNSGTITMDGVDLYDFSKASYRDNFSYVSTHPVFFKGSIYKNLSVYEKNRSIIYQTCKELGIYDYIMGLPKKFNTEISTLPYEKLYLLGLARAILTGSEILIVYEFPQNLTDAETENIKHILHKMHGGRTIIIFSAKDYCNDISDKIITMERGEIKDISFNTIK